jgi:hypothetical protein
VVTRRDDRRAHEQTGREEERAVRAEVIEEQARQRRPGHARQARQRLVDAQVRALLIVRRSARDQRRQRRVVDAEAHRHDDAADDHGPPRHRRADDRHAQREKQRARDDQARLAEARHEAPDQAALDQGRDQTDDEQVAARVLGGGERLLARRVRDRCVEPEVARELRQSEEQEHALERGEGEDRQEREHEHRAEARVGERAAHVLEREDPRAGALRARRLLERQPSKSADDADSPAAT